jgi:hypothetical protein
MRAKLIVDHETGRSKGYAFFEFSNYKEFNRALNLKDSLIFGRQKLVLNSAKNRFDESDEETNNDLSMQSLDSFNSLNQTSALSSSETRVSSIRNSKESNNSISEEKGKNENFQENSFDNELTSQIKDSLKKLSEQYYQCDNKTSLFNYYCSPFIYNSQHRKDFYIVNKIKENRNDNNFNNKCPFELCEDIY